MHRRILFFTHHLRAGGAERTVCALSEYINRNIPDTESFVCVVYDDPELRKTMENVIVMKTHSEPDDPRWLKAVRVLRQIHEMRRIKKEYRFDACISFLPGADIINVLSGTGEKKIVAVRSRESLFVHSIWKKLYVKTAYTLCDRIAAVSNTVHRDVAEYFHVPEQKIVTIYNALRKIPAAAPVHPGASAFFSRHSFCFICVGRLESEKGIDHLIRAFHEILQWNSGNREGQPGLVIVGSGSLEEPLMSLAWKLKIEEHILFTGYVVNPHDYLRRSDAFVLSSDVEGMPNVVLEALQCGLPVIATACGAEEILCSPEQEEYIRAHSSELQQPVMCRYGIITPVCGDNSGFEENFDIQSELTGPEHCLAEAMYKVMSEQDLRLRYIAGAEECLKRFQMPEIVDQWLHCIDECS